MMNVNQFCGTLEHIAKDEKTAYMKGGLCAPITSAIITAKAKQYPSWYTPPKINALSKKLGYYGTDCICLIKAVLWGWSKVKYNSNDVPDVTADTMITKCHHISKDLSEVPKGALLWKKGHVGVHIGGGLVVECTNTYKDGVQFSSLYEPTAVKSKCFGQYTTRINNWEKWGLLPYVDYNEQYEVSKTETIKTQLLELRKMIDKILKEV